MKNKTTLTEEQQKELQQALMTRAGMITRYGAGYAIKWFAQWNAEFQKRINNENN